MKLTKYGKREWGIATAVAVVLLAGTIACGIFLSHSAGLYLSILVIALWVAFVGFFRDPSRAITLQDDLLLSPADGVVKDIELIRASDYPQLAEVFEGRDMLRVGIFLSVFNVHLNRAPVDWTLSFKYYKKGAFHDARDGRAGRENESMLVGGIGSIDGIRFPVAVKQISGAVARRIVCPVEPGAVLKKGERYGMIKFGSRTELYLPAGKCFEVNVKVGDRVFGGTTIVADILPAAKEKNFFSEDSSSCVCAEEKK